MVNSGIPQDKAELLSVLLESVLYGFSLLMFAGTIWALVFQRSTNRINHKMLAVACTLLLLSTLHVVIDIIRIMDGLILYRDTWPGGPIAFFLDPTQWTYMSRNVVLTAQTLVGDGVVIYRCYAAWESKLVLVIPVTLWCGIAGIGFASPFTGDHIGQLVAAFYVISLSSSVITTSLLVYRIWYVDYRTKRLFQGRTSELRPILHVIIDAGLMYSLTILSGFICFLISSNGQSVILDMVTPIISIAFYMVIFRIGIVRAKQTPNTIPLTHSSGSGSSSNERRAARVRVSIVRSTESKADNAHYLNPMESDNNFGGVKLDDGQGIV